MREIRTEKGMTLTQIANTSGMSKQQLQSLESSKGYPRIQTLIRVADALGCPLRDLLDEPLQLGLSVPREKDTDYPCANAESCKFFKRKEWSWKLDE